MLGLSYFLYVHFVIFSHCIYHLYFFALFFLLSRLFYFFVSSLFVYVSVLYLYFVCCERSRITTPRETISGARIVIPYIFVFTTINDGNDGKGNTNNRAPVVVGYKRFVRRPAHRLTNVRMFVVVRPSVAISPRHVRRTSR